MRRNLIYAAPLVLLILGFLRARQVFPYKHGAYQFGFGLGMVLAASIPALFFALIHFLVVRKRPGSRVESAFEVLDVEKTVEVKTSYWYYFAWYLAGVGALIAILTALKPV